MLFRACERGKSQEKADGLSARTAGLRTTMHSLVLEASTCVTAALMLSAAPSTLLS